MSTERRWLESVEKAIGEVDEAVKSREFETNLREAVSFVASYLDEELAFSENVLFIVGGKSRRLAEVLVLASIKRTKRYREVATRAYSSRLRLSDVENSQIYNDEGEYEWSQMPERLKVILGSNSFDTVLFFDDHVVTGIKASGVLHQLEKYVDKARFVAFAADEFVISGRGAWVGQRKDVVFPVGLSRRFNRVLGLIASGYSDQVGIRMGKVWFGRLTWIDSLDWDNLRKIDLNMASMPGKYLDVVRSILEIPTDVTNC